MFNALPGPVLIILYLVLAAGICFFSKKLADYVDALDKKTTISGAFIGAVLLAAVTSLPELFTSISATILLPESADLVVGNILGSNLFNLAIIGVAMICFFKLFGKAKFEFKSHFTVLIGVVAIYGVIAYGLLGSPEIQPIFADTGYLSHINFLAVLIAIIYGVTVFLQPKEQEDDDEEKEDPLPNLSLKQVVIRFIIYAILLVATSILITYDTDAIAAKYSIDATLAGAIFLAIATSLPELVSTFVLCKKGNFNAALGDIVGSCLFNFIIIAIAEFMAYKSSLLPGFISGSKDVMDAILMLAITVGILIFLTISLITNFVSNKKKVTQGAPQYIIYVISGIALTSGYILFLVLSNVL